MREGIPHRHYNLTWIPGCHQTLFDCSNNDTCSAWAKGVQLSSGVRGRRGIKISRNIFQSRNLILWSQEALQRTNSCIKLFQEAKKAVSHSGEVLQLLPPLLQHGEPWAIAALYKLLCTQQSSTPGAGMMPLSHLIPQPSQCRHLSAVPPCQPWGAHSTVLPVLLPAEQSRTRALKYSLQMQHIQTLKTSH